MARRFIEIKGAKEHNLKNISIDIPRDQLVVITGPSGSGKSSLAFDTLYAEGQRRYVESLSAYARQFLQLMQKPNVDSIEGLSPSISIDQRTTSKNPRSTVGTITELYDYIRLLFARIGVPYSPTTGLPIESQTVTQMVDRISELPQQSKLLLLAPFVRGRKGEHKKELLGFLKKGFQRVKIDGATYDLEDPPSLDRQKKHTIEIIVDRFILPKKISTEWRRQITDSLETALKISDGIVCIEDVDKKTILTLSERFACPVSGFTIESIEPRLFSFNSPYGACEACEGLGFQMKFDPDLIVPNPTLTLFEGAVMPWFYRQSENSIQKHLLLAQSLIKRYNESMRIPFEELQEEVKQIILHGQSGKFEGVIPYLKRRLRVTDSEIVRESIRRFQSEQICDVCGGQRLKPEALCVKIQEKNVFKVCDFSIKEAFDWFSGLNLSQKQKHIAARILKEIKSRLNFLINVGLDYLTLSRSATTLSGGESQRIRLASQIGSGLTGVLYVLDEPSIGLHQRDNHRLLETLKNLRDVGNSVIVVEHDEEAIKSADHIIDMGPAAGVHGGDVVVEGTLKQILENEKSLTGQYLSGKKCIEIPKKRRAFPKNNVIEIIGATSHNLKNITVQFPLGCFVCVTGVSGSGKSTLVIETLYKGLARLLRQGGELPGGYKKINGVWNIDKVIDIDQSPIGRTPRSNPATYVGCFTAIREWFSSLPDSRSRGYEPGRFSFNVKGGRCEACKGDGVIRIEMHFLPDVFVTCDQCDGKRYNEDTLDIHFKGKSIADILNMTVEESLSFFKHHNAIYTKLKTLNDIGLGYINLGQSATTLSGGEAQRIKLSKELSKRSTSKTVYILDEPTTGLHFEDIRHLLNILQKLVAQGNTVIVIEHNLDVIKTADYIIDIGPEGGAYGGEIVALGTPEEISKNSKSYTGFYLKKYL
ncbi:MAG: excinuclease ABC subunit UvrA [Alphaproteobacteria bacterium]